eukprot:173653-Chlamydomonas_euryale.AAC.4
MAGCYLNGCKMVWVVNGEVLHARSPTAVCQVCGRQMCGCQLCGNQAQSVDRAGVDCLVAVRMRVLSAAVRTGVSPDPRTLPEGWPY